MHKTILATVLVLGGLGDVALAQHNSFNNPNYPGVQTDSKNPRSDVGTYSIWLVPSGSQRTQAAAVIDALAAYYRTPRFDPHVTVLGDIKGTLQDVEKVALELARRTKRPIEVGVRRISWDTGDYWRSFYLEFGSSRALDKLYKDTCEVAGRCHKLPYHMSLMYTNDLSEQEKRAAAANLFSQFDLLDSMVLDHLRICTSGDVPEKWTCLVDIKLQ